MRNYRRQLFLEFRIGQRDVFNRFNLGFVVVFQLVSQIEDPPLTLEHTPLRVTL